MVHIDQKVAITLMSLTTVAATSAKLFVSSYAGNITTLQLAAANNTSNVVDNNSRSGGNSSNYGFETVATNSNCGPNPSWLTIDTKNNVLYCLDEGLEVPNGSLSSYTIANDGSLELVHKEQTISGPVSGAIYNNHGSLALAHYSGSAVSVWSLGHNDQPANFAHEQDLSFTLTKPGPNPDRQEAPHEHEAIVDPSGQYVLVPDLGADFVRVFAYDSASGKLVDKAPLQVKPGSGPRHAAFYVPGDDVKNTGGSGEGKTIFLYVVTELANTVTSYQVTYLPNNGGLSFDQVYTNNVYGGSKPLPAGIAAAEIAVSPDNRFLLISNRNDSAFDLDKATSKSDSVATFALQPDGKLDFVQLAPIGGSYPRQVSLNSRGDLLAAGLQMDSAVVLLERDVSTGRIGSVVARAAIEGQVTCVRWSEAVFDGTYANA